MSKIKVACCWDDGVLTDAGLIKILRKYNAKATFNLNVGLMDETEPGKMVWNHDPKYPCWHHKGFLCGKFARNQIKDIYTGFKVASHCWKHEHAAYCSTEEFTKAAVDCKNYLEDLFQMECPGFAWPCGAYTPETCASLRAAGFKYGRTTINVDDITKCADTMMLHSHCHFMDVEFYRKYEKAKETGAFYFWGHTYETFNYGPLWDQVEDKIRYITEDPDAEWVDVIDLVPLCHK